MRHRPDAWSLAAAIVAVGGAAFVLWLARGLTFFSDEWAFIEGRSLTDPTTWLPPHNEHWSTLPVVAYRLLVETVGLRSYVPYLAVVLLLHLVVVWLVHRHVRRTAGPVLALGSATVLALLGSGFENLLWGFQTGFVGATAAGLGALAVLDARPRLAAAIGIVGLLVVSLISAGLGLVFSAAVAVEMLLRREWRRWLPVLAVPGGLYAAWFLLFGRSGVGAVRDVSVSAALRIPEFVAAGFGNAVGSILGVGPVLGLVGAGAIGVGVVVAHRRGRPVPSRTVAAAAAVALLYSLIALSRAGVMAGQAHYTRYTYVGVVVLLVGLAPLVGPALQETWRVRRRLRPWLAGAAVLALVLALAWNVRLLFGGREVFLDRAAFTRALVTVALRDPLPSGVDPERSLVYVPSPASIRRIVAAHGSPLTDVLAPGAVEEPDTATWTRAEDQLRDPKVPLPEELD